MDEAEDITTVDELARALGESTDPATVALDRMENVLLSRIPDAVERWTAVREVSRGITPTLERVRALCVAQLIAEGRSVAEAADELGINRQRAHALLSAHDQPTPRRLAENPLRGEVGYRYGEYLGIASMIAEAVDQARPRACALPQIEKLQSVASGSPTAIVTRIRRMIHMWTRGPAGVSTPGVESLLVELEHAAARLDDLHQYEPFFPPDQQAHMWLAISTTRVRLR